jgi:hypothetical protein
MQFEAVTLEQRPDASEMDSRDGELDVLVFTRLAPEEKVHGPAAGDPPRTIEDGEPVGQLARMPRSPVV